MSKRLLALSLIVVAAGLAGCDDDDNNPPETVNSFAVRQIETATCEEKLPPDINLIQFEPDFSAVDVEALTPDCDS